MSYDPTTRPCFWCSMVRGEAPIRLCLDYDPCDACEMEWAAGVVIIECEECDPRDKTKQQIRRGLVPTGRSLVLKPEAIDRVFTADVVETLRQRRKYAQMFIGVEGFCKLLARPDAHV